MLKMLFILVLTGDDDNLGSNFNNLKVFINDSLHAVDNGGKIILENGIYKGSKNIELINR
ncbi:hypothetical protein ALNOE001_20140 [Candidatus Methanobinarius endosymbioticus]|uniref:Uncharacterized protein n=1 Tax=Candidatus Methanobinarius endosymbioticus TaxID=2006182 RepID=A0A366M9L1_9EURY|nr:hypothetical protein ALNOE001_20140 [Candidatus Methanobinarius endosymbioticus]